MRGNKMKDLTREEIKKIVKESNKETLSEYFPSYADEEVTARKENLQRYHGFVEGSKNFLDQIIEKAKMDYQEGIISDADIDYLINDQCDRAMKSIEFVISSLIALKEQGIKPSETGPIYPTSRYEE
jgi:hypothetical protein